MYNNLQQQSSNSNNYDAAVLADFNAALEYQSFSALAESQRVLPALRRSAARQSFKIGRTLAAALQLIARTNPY